MYSAGFASSLRGKMMKLLCCRGSRAGYKEQVVLKLQATRLPPQSYFGASEATIFSKRWSSDIQRPTMDAQLA
jgi:hypothetical protein